jgi:uridine kinase
MYFNLWYTPNFFLFLIFITAKLTNMLIVGIAGGTGSGKSTVVKKIMEVFPDDEVIVVPQDSYYRDIIESGRSVHKVLERYYDTMKPSHLQFIEPSEHYADIIIPGGCENQVRIEVLISTIEKHLSKIKP